MSDITLNLSARDGTYWADLAWAGNDLATGHDLKTAVLISLFSDAAAPPDYDYGNSDRDPRGWWAGPIGSLLWTFARTTRTTETRLAIIDAARSALTWLIEDAVASSVEVDALFTGKAGIALTVNIIQQTGTLASTKFSFVWSDI